MKTLKAGKPIDLAAILYPVSTDTRQYFIKCWNKTMHREALLSMQLRAVMYLVDNKDVCEAVKMNDEELAISEAKSKERKRLNYKRKHHPDNLTWEDVNLILT
jgi:hypothetical protein